MKLLKAIGRPVWKREVDTEVSQFLQKHDELFSAVSETFLRVMAGYLFPSGCKPQDGHVYNQVNLWSFEKHELFGNNLRMCVY